MKFLKFSSFCISLFEGGNVVLDSGQSAQKIPMQQVDRKEIQNLIKTALKEFNIKFNKIYQTELWPDFDLLIKNDLLFSGSSRLLMKLDLDDNDFSKKKPLVGDIDLMYDEKKIDLLKDFLKTNKGETFGDLKFIDKGGNSPTQENTIFEMPKKYWDRVRYIQIDFEPVPYNDQNKPSEFSIFAHYSSWKDITEGIKGVFVKYLYRTIFSNVEKIENYVILTKTGKISTSALYKDSIGKWKFSVDKGVRIGFEPVFENGEIKKIDGKFVYKQISTSDSTYEKSMKTLFQLAFNREPKANDLNRMKSFISTLDLIKENCPEKIEIIYKGFINLLWGTEGSKAQNLERNNDKKDFTEKSAAHEKFLEIFPELTKYDNKVQEMIEKYYKN